MPQILPRLLEVEPSRYLLIDQLIEANLDTLFTGMEVEEHHLFRVTRNADLAIEEDEADDLLLAIEEELRRRRFGEAVRLEVERSMPAATRALLLRGLGLARRTATRSAACWTCPACGRSRAWTAPISSPRTGRRSRRRG